MTHLGDHVSCETVKTGCTFVAFFHNIVPKHYAGKAVTCAFLLICYINVYGEVWCHFIVETLEVAYVIWTTD